MDNTKVQEYYKTLTDKAVNDYNFAYSKVQEARIKYVEILKQIETASAELNKINVQIKSAKIELNGLQEQIAHKRNISDIMDKNLSYPMANEVNKSKKF